MDDCPKCSHTNNYYRESYVGEDGNDGVDRYYRCQKCGLEYEAWYSRGSSTYTLNWKGGSQTIGGDSPTGSSGKKLPKFVFAVLLILLSIGVYAKVGFTQPEPPPAELVVFNPFPRTIKAQFRNHQMEIEPDSFAALELMQGGKIRVSFPDGTVIEEADIPSADSSSGQSALYNPKARGQISINSDFLPIRKGNQRVSLLGPRGTTICIPGRAIEGERWVKITPRHPAGSTPKSAKPK